MTEIEGECAGFRFCFDRQIQSLDRLFTEDIHILDSFGGMLKVLAFKVRSHSSEVFTAESGIHILII